MKKQATQKRNAEENEQTATAALDAAFKRAIADAEREEPERQRRGAEASAAMLERLNAARAELTKSPRPSKTAISTAFAALLDAEAYFPTRKAQAAARDAQEADARANRLRAQGHAPEAQKAQSEAAMLKAEAASLDAIQQGKAELWQTLNARQRQSFPARLLQAIDHFAKLHPHARADEFLDLATRGKGLTNTEDDRKVHEILLDAIAEEILTERTATPLRQYAAKFTKRRAKKPAQK